jgi:hypothetical protein
VPPGSLLLSEVILSSPILAEDRGIPEGIPGGIGGEGASGSGASAGNGFEFGVDPSLDPELAMVMPNHLLSLLFTVSLMTSSDNLSLGFAHVDGGRSG